MRKKDRPKDAAEWLAEAGDDGLSPAQRVALADWLRESPAHVRELVQVTLIHQDLGHLRISPEQIGEWVQDAKGSSREPTRIVSDDVTTDAEAAWLPVRMPGRAASYFSRRIGWMTAACCAVVLMTAGIIFRWEDGRFTTSLGEQRVITLEDGSVIEINTDSALQVRYTEKQRSIHMTRGEAFFRVAHDVTRPFIVSAGDADVKAVGTQFNVRLAKDATLVSVLEGTVEVRDDTAAADASSGMPGLKVTTGEEASITRPRFNAQNAHLALAKLSNASPQRAASWTRGRVEFENMPLDDVLKEFRRYRNVQVLVDDEDIRQLKLTGSFDAHDPDSALAFIATLPGLVVKQIDPQSYRVTRDNHSTSSRP